MRRPGVLIFFSLFVLSPVLGLAGGEGGSAGRSKPLKRPSGLFQEAAESRRQSRGRLFALAKKSPRAERSSRRRAEKGAKNPSGYKIPPLKKTAGGKKDLLRRMGLKKGDVARGIDGRPVSSRRDFFRGLRRAKSKRRFSVELERGGRPFRFVYERGAKKRFRLSKRSPLPGKAAGRPAKARLAQNKSGSRLPASLAGASKASASKASDSRTAAKKNSPKKRAAGKSQPAGPKPPAKKSSEKKRPDPKTAAKKQRKWTKKQKRLLQNSYTSAPKTLIYDKPDFDAEQIHFLPLGAPVIISKKILRPKHGFGSFYKAFITDPRKIIGYVSEAEVIPQFVRRGKKHFLNPLYKKTARQIEGGGKMSLHKLPDPPEAGGGEYDELESSLPPPGRGQKYRYAGFSAGMSKFSFSGELFREDFQLGLKFSGYNLLISSWNMDYNLSFSLLNPYYWHGDIMTGYAFFQGMRYHIYLLAGLQLNVDINTQSGRRHKVAPGMIGALSLFAPFNKRLIFRADLRGGCEFHDCKGTLAPGALVSFQIGF